MLRNPKRSEFLTKQDFQEAEALVRLARLAMKHGASVSDVCVALGRAHWFSNISTYLTPENSDANGQG